MTVRSNSAGSFCSAATLLHFCLLLLLMMSPFVRVSAQSGPPEQPLIFFDAFGNLLPEDRMLILAGGGGPLPGDDTEICGDPQSEFICHFDAGSGFHSTDINGPAFQAVACQVFHDLGQFINSAVDGNAAADKVHIRFAESITLNILARASATYATAQTEYPSIVDNFVWQTLNTGVDAWAFSISPIGVSNWNAEHYHGLVAGKCYRLFMEYQHGIRNCR